MDLVCAGEPVRARRARGWMGFHLRKGGGEETNNSSSISTSELPVAETNSSRSISAMASSSLGFCGNRAAPVHPVPLSTELLPLVILTRRVPTPPTRYRHAEVRMALRARQHPARLTARREDRPEPPWPYRSERGPLLHPAVQSDLRLLWRSWSHLQLRSQPGRRRNPAAPACGCSNGEGPSDVTDRDPCALIQVRNGAGGSFLLLAARESSTCLVGYPEHPHPQPLQNRGSLSGACNLALLVARQI